MNISLYISIYKNPTAKYLPSCSLGWVDYKDKKLKNTYFNLITNSDKLNNQDFFKFLKYNKIDVIIVDKDTNNLKFNNVEISDFGYKFYKLYKNNIIFIKN